jgi:hypothetical protein
MNSKNKPVGGRGKKAPYSTQIMRVPEPLISEVQYLIDNYRDSLTVDSDQGNQTILLTKEKLTEEINSILKKRKSAKASFEFLVNSLFSKYND